MHNSEFSVSNAMQLHEAAVDRWPLFSFMQKIRNVYGAKQR